MRQHRAGVPCLTLAIQYGIGESTVQRWCNRGERRWPSNITALIPEPVRDDIRASRRGGSPDETIAVKTGLTALDVRRACHGVPRPPRQPSWDMYRTQPLLDALDEAGVTHRAATRAGGDLRAAIRSGWVNAYTVGIVCLRCLHTHPVALYGESWWKPIVQAGVDGGPAHEWKVESA